MTEQQIVNKAVERAVAHGWDGKGYTFNVVSRDRSSYYTVAGYPLEQAKDILAYHPDTDVALEMVLDGVDIYRLIFNHQFARHLWGEKQYGLTDMGKWEVGSTWNIYTLVLPEWKMRLQQMVLKVDPFHYLEKCL